jgi:hypothetical protein
MVPMMMLQEQLQLLKWQSISMAKTTMQHSFVFFFAGEEKEVVGSKHLIKKLKAQDFKLACEQY